MKEWTPAEFEHLIERNLEADRNLLGKAWDYAKPRWAWHIYSLYRAHVWVEDKPACDCHDFTIGDLMAQVI